MGGGVDEEAVPDARAAVVAEVDYRAGGAGEEGGQRGEEEVADGALVRGRGRRGEAVAGQVRDEEGDLGAQRGEDVAPPAMKMRSGQLCLGVPRRSWREVGLSLGASSFCSEGRWRRRTCMNSEANRGRNTGWVHRRRGRGRNSGLFRPWTGLQCGSPVARDAKS